MTKPPHSLEFDPISAIAQEQVENDVTSSIVGNFLPALPAWYEEQLRDNGKANAETFRLKAHLTFCRAYLSKMLVQCSEMVHETQLRLPSSDLSIMSSLSSH